MRGGGGGNGVAGEVMLERTKPRDPFRTKSRRRLDLLGGADHPGRPAGEGFARGHGDDVGDPDQSVRDLAVEVSAGGDHDRVEVQAAGEVDQLADRLDGRRAENDRFGVGVSESPGQAPELGFVPLLMPATSTRTPRRYGCSSCSTNPDAPCFAKATR